VAPWTSYPFIQHWLRASFVARRSSATSAAMSGIRACCHAYLDVSA